LKVFAVTTTFFPDESLVYKNWKTISNEIEKYIVVNNSQEYLFKLLVDCDGLEIISNRNVGVSGGLNIGIRRAIELGADFIILFDQDSSAQNGLIRQLLAIPGVLQKQVIVAPNILDQITGAEIHSKFFNLGKTINERYVQVSRTQTSGLLVPVVIFEKVGLFNENYFLDFVDTEWCLRAFSAGYRILIDKVSFLHHEFGEGEMKILWYTYKYGKPFREYYGARDTLYLLSESRGPVGFKLKLLARFFWSLFNILFLDHKILRFSFFGRGIKAYLNGVRGKGLLD